MKMKNTYKLLSENRFNKSEKTKNECRKLSIS